MTLEHAPKRRKPTTTRKYIPIWPFNYIMETLSYLKKLIGKTVTKTDIKTSSVSPITKFKVETINIKTSIVIQLHLEDYLLNINNQITISPDYKEFNDLKGLKIIATDESNEEVKLTFSNGTVLYVNLRDEAYWDPEAMCLYGPDNFFIAWN